MHCHNVASISIPFFPNSRVTFYPSTLIIYAYCGGCSVLCAYCSKMAGFLPIQFSLSFVCCCCFFFSSPSFYCYLSKQNTHSITIKHFYVAKGREKPEIFSTWMATYRNNQCVVASSKRVVADVNVLRLKIIHIATDRYRREGIWKWHWCTAKFWMKREREKINSKEPRQHQHRIQNETAKTRKSVSDWYSYMR